MRLASIFPLVVDDDVLLDENGLKRLMNENCLLLVGGELFGDGDVVSPALVGVKSLQVFVSSFGDVALLEVVDADGEDDADVDAPWS